MQPAAWSGSRSTQARAALADRTSWPAPCARCGRPLQRSDKWTLGHIVGRDEAPQLTWQPSNWQVECPQCSAQSGAQYGNRKRGQSKTINTNNARRMQRVSINDESPASTTFHIDIPTINVDYPKMHSDGFPLPRIETPVRPDTDYTISDLVLEWIDANAPGPPLLPWQRYVCRRGFETFNGRMRRQIAFLVSRQQGKTFLMQRILLARAAMSEVFGECSVLNSHQDAGQAVELLESLAREMGTGYLRAKANGCDWWLNARDVKSMGSGPVWRARAQTRGAITGQGGVSMVFLDELQDARREVVNRTVRPILSGARVANPQAWFAGTGERDESHVLRDIRAASLASDDTLWLEWSAPPGCATDDRVAWLYASPDWSSAREDALAADLRTMPERDFRSEYLVQHDAQLTYWLDPLIVQARGSASVTGTPVVAAVEVDVGGGAWSAAVGDSAGRVRVLPPSTHDDAMAWLAGCGAPLLLAHPSVVERLPEGLPPARGATQKEQQAALLLLGERVRSGSVSWDHGEIVADQFAHAVMVNADGGPKLAASKSRGDVSLVKAIALCVWHSSQKRDPVLV